MHGCSREKIHWLHVWAHFKTGPKRQSAIKYELFSNFIILMFILKDISYSIDVFFSFNGPFDLPSRILWTYQKKKKKLGWQRIGCKAW